MITEDRLRHILGVARKAQELALKVKPNDETYAQDMFLLGFLHDVGYEFTPTGKGHSSIGGELLKRCGYTYWKEVANHGCYENEQMSDELFILNCADMSIGADGKCCTMVERLEDIGGRYGKDSSAYQKATIEIRRLQSDPRYLKITK